MGDLKAVADLADSFMAKLQAKQDAASQSTTSSMTHSTAR